MAGSTALWKLLKRVQLRSEMRDSMLEGSAPLEPIHRKDQRTLIGAQDLEFNKAKSKGQTSVDKRKAMLSERRLDPMSLPSR